MNEKAKLIVETLRYCEESGARCGGCPSGAMICPSTSEIADLIESLSTQLEQVTRERDAAVRQMCEADHNNAFACNFCKHDDVCDGRLISCGDCDMDCPCNTCVDHSNWQWRGVEVEG